MSPVNNSSGKTVTWERVTIVVFGLLTGSLTVGMSWIKADIEKNTETNARQSERLAALETRYESIQQYLERLDRGMEKLTSTHERKAVP